VVVSTTDSAALRDAQSTVSRIRTYGIPTHLVVNRVSKPLLRKLHTTIDDAMDVSGLPLLGVIPEDQKVPLAAGLGKSLITLEHRGAAKAYYRIALRLTGRRVTFARL
jgi:septum site-determining protein MinD